MIQEVKMTPEQFVYWLQGFMEIGNPEMLSKEQVMEIRNHLKEVFHKVTPMVTTWPEQPTIHQYEALPFNGSEFPKEGTFIC